MTTTSLIQGGAAAVEHTASALRPVARWTLRVGPDGRSRLTMTWQVPQVENIAAVVDSTSAY
jgi:hypothetical protein